MKPSPDWSRMSTLDLNDPSTENGEEMDQKSPKSEEEEDGRLVVGVDFGTTYSGVAIVYSKNPEEIDVIKDWPGGNGITSDKVPTEIGYVSASNGNANGASNTNGARGTNGAKGSNGLNTNGSNGTNGSTNTAEDTGPKTIKWGFQFKPEEPRLRCIKLFLDRNQRLPHFVSPLDTAAQLRKYDKTVNDAVSDYLTQIYNHTIDSLTKRYGETFIAKTRLEFVLTVPAVWSDSAKNATLLAAERAGMGSRHDLKLISEPEAAAVYTLKAIQPNHLKVGDNFIVCDAGGGTVDLIAYKIIQLAPLRVEESAVGTGGLCGSAFLNYRFEDHVRTRIGEERYNNMREKKAKTWNMGLKYFEEFVKRNYDENEEQEINVPFPGLPDDEEADIDCGFMLMRNDQIKGILDPVIKEVIQLVEGQVETIRSRGGIVAGIVLVGGFGQSNYMYKQMKSHFNAAPPPPYSERPSHSVPIPLHQPIEVMHPMYAWTAVVRGAVIRGLEGSMVISRRSRWHYGTSYATVFDETKHPVKDRYWSPLWERWMVSDRMQWHIAKGAQVSESEPISFHYTRNFRPGQSLVVEDDLIACSDDEAPDAYSKELIHVCTLTTDLRAVPKNLFTRLTTTKGVEFDNLDFSLDMRVQSAGLVFELRVEGVRYGAVEAKFH
ncbi:actin-like ATPase domain-containing protein [Trichodelitschia bisporula]|uniref:Actin-like ATPase domain-containing protein n=1 Tax=Trichodelitschia bisporula TaxID=703511 RepID=A0A6G1I5K9_9PEZI|nr:actin-like ATPase domain-containing protein [Trichodelitschia bisporula]